MADGDVQFDIDTQQIRTVPQVKVSKFATFVMKYSGGFIKDETQANYVLLAFSVIAFAVAFILISGGSGTGNASQIPVVPAI